MTPAAPRFLSAATSEQGLVRPSNEDRVYCDDSRGVFLVVDGMGGHLAGEKAAEIAVEHMRLRLERQTGSVERRVREAIALANNAIYEVAQTNPDWHGMACVLTVAVIQDSEVTIGHVGDSRLYRIRRGQIEKITHDHSPVGEREDQGELSETDAMKHPRRNEVYRDVGSQARTPDDEAFIEILKVPFEADTALLLCSDGLSDAISSAEILAIVQRNAGDRWTTVRGLFEAASGRGQDNISAVLVEGEEFAASLRRRSITEPRRVVITDSREEDTGRMTIAPVVPWYVRRSAWFMYGLAAGLLVGLFLVALAVAERPGGPKLMTVAQPATIGSAVQKARAGDTVVVGSGTYAESLVIPSGVSIVAQRPYEAVIAGPITADGVQNARIEGFTIRGGIRITNSDLIIARNDISDAASAGIEFAGNSRGAVVGCSVHNNAGPGIAVKDAAAPAVEHNAIWANGSVNPKLLQPGLLIDSSMRPRVEANVFGTNGAEAIWTTVADEALTARNFFNGPPDDRRPKVRVLHSGEAVLAPR